MLSLSRLEKINGHSQHYLNRLSDLLFVLSRVLAVGGGGEVFWDATRNG
jgi:cob(I)alamin adenosyltransferase